MFRCLRGEKWSRAHLWAAAGPAAPRLACCGTATSPATSSSSSSTTASRKGQSCPQTFPKTFWRYKSVPNEDRSRVINAKFVLVRAESCSGPVNQTNAHSRKIAAQRYSLNKHSFATHDGNGVVTLRPFFIHFEIPQQLRNFKTSISLSRHNNDK